MSKPIHRIVREYLKANGFDGLMEEDGECGCDLAGLMPCDETPTKCRAGYKIPCPEDCQEHDWHISAAPITTKEPEPSG